MRIFVITLGTLFVAFISLMTVKYWGKTQMYVDYKHPMFDTQSAPLEFYKPDFTHLNEALKSDKNLYLDVTITFDQKLVIPRRQWVSTEKPLRLFAYEDVKSDVILVTDVKNSLISKKIIFNLSENAQAIHETFAFTMKQLGLEKGENFIVTSQYEAPIKALKEAAPALLFGSTQPEILKIVAMQSMYLIEAVNIRADVIVHPLKIKKHDFFNEELMSELNKRHKRIVVGPVNSEELTQAMKLQPYAVILNY
ncbi:hypothetical protein K2P97_00890 [bacterium]|nr:hypothetical protein [bacterium]